MLRQQNLIQRSLALHRSVRLALCLAFLGPLVGLHNLINQTCAYSNYLPILPCMKTHQFIGIVQRDSLITHLIELAATLRIKVPTSARRSTAEVPFSAEIFGSF
jgi:hypothetical protein